MGAVDHKEETVMDDMDFGPSAEEGDPMLRAIEGPAVVDCFFCGEPGATLCEECRAETEDECPA